MGTARAPLAGRIPRPAKLRRDRYASSDIPANIRTAGAPIDAEDRAYLRRKLGAKLGASLQAAMDAALQRTERAVRRSVERRTTRAR